MASSNGNVLHVSHMDKEDPMANTGKYHQGKQKQRIGVIYARYSSHNQKEESIEQQVEACQQFAASNNITVLRVYDDRAVSGRTEKRSSFQRLLNVL